MTKCTVCGNTDVNSSVGLVCPWCAEGVMQLVERLRLTAAGKGPA